LKRRPLKETAEIDIKLSSSLSEFLLELAGPLLQAGITPKRFGDIAAQVFVRAACRASVLRNGRVNQSRVAVLTGLSRTQVRRLLGKPGPSTRRTRSRTMRVVDGWLSDRRFHTKSGEPKALRIRDGQCSFATLVHEYAGDVPPRAVLDELRRMRLVRESDAGIELRKSPISKSSSELARSLSHALPVISDSFGIASATAGSHATAPIYRLTIAAPNPRSLITARERAVTGATSFLNGLDRSLSVRPRTRKSNKGQHRVTVTVLIREHQPQKSIGR
jgi:hypothetical protein